MSARRDLSVARSGWIRADAAYRLALRVLGADRRASIWTLRATSSVTGASAESNSRRDPRLCCGFREFVCHAPSPNDTARYGSPQESGTPTGTPRPAREWEQLPASQPISSIRAVFLRISTVQGSEFR